MVKSTEYLNRLSFIAHFVHLVHFFFHNLRVASLVRTDLEKYAFMRAEAWHLLSSHFEWFKVTKTFLT